MLCSRPQVLVNGVAWEVVPDSTQVDIPPKNATRIDGHAWIDWIDAARFVSTLTFEVANDAANRARVREIETSPAGAALLLINNGKEFAWQGMRLLSIREKARTLRLTLQGSLVT